MTKSKKSPAPSTADNLNPLLESIMDAIVRHSTLDQEAVETLRRALVGFSG